MSPEKIHSLVHSLSKEEKRYFRAFSKSSKETLEMKLYDLLLAEKVLSKKALERIRKGKFKSSQMFYNYRVALGEKIIASLVSYEGENTSPTSFIEKAIAQDAIELGEKALNKEMKSALDSENFERLQYLYHLKSALENQYKVHISVKDKFPSPQNCEAKINQVKTLIEIQARIASGFKLRAESKSLLANTITSQLKTIEPLSIRAKVIWKKLFTGVYTLREEYFIAFTKQQLVLEVLRDSPQNIFSPIQHIEEVNLGIRLAMRSGLREEAFLLMQKLESIPVRQRRERNLKQEGNIATSIAIAEHFGDQSMMENSYAKFLQNMDLFSVENQSLVFYLAGLTYLMNHNFDSAILSLQKLKNIPSNNWLAVTWEPDLLLSLAYLGIGKVKYFESAIRSAERRVRNNDLKYPSLTINIVKKLGATSEVTSGYLSDSISKLTILLQQKSEKRSALMLDIRYWLLGEQQGVLPSQFLNQAGKNDHVFAS